MTIKDILYNVRHDLMMYITNESREHEQMKFHCYVSSECFAITFNTEEDFEQWKESHLHFMLRVLSKDYGTKGYSKFIQYDFFIPD